MIGLPSDSPSGLGDLESKLYRQLEIPVNSLHAHAGSGDRNAASTVSLLRELRREVIELQRDAARIGTLPEHYPKHVVVVMKTIAALLPWYTRPIVQFSRRCAQTTNAMSRVLGEVLRNQEELSKEIAHLKASISGRPETLERLRGERHVGP